MFDKADSGIGVNETPGFNGPGLMAKFSLLNSHCRGLIAKFSLPSFDERIKIAKF
jgi:hypothetical protein